MIRLARRYLARRRLARITQAKRNSVQHQIYLKYSAAARKAAATRKARAA